MPLWVPPITTQPDPLDLAQADAIAAGAIYNQTQMTSVVALANATKAKLNTVLGVLRGANVVK